MKHNVVLDNGQLAPLYENVTSSTKPEIQRTALLSEEDRATALVTCTENFLKFGHVTFEI